MNSSLIEQSQRAYGLLLKCYPARFRQEFEDEMRYVFCATLEAAYRQDGSRGLIVFWGRSLVDAVASILTEQFEEQKGRLTMNIENRDFLKERKVFLWIPLATALLLLLPLIAMQFSDDVVWTALDFTVMGFLLLGAGFAFVLTARRTDSRQKRILIGMVVAAGFFYVWAELAVGIFLRWGS